MSNRSHAVKSFLFDLIGQFSIQIATFIVTPIFISNISDALYGLWLTIGAVVMWFSLADGGIGVTLTRHLVSLRVKNEKVVDVINSAVFFFLIISFLLFILSLPIYSFLINFFHIEPKDRLIFLLLYEFSVAACIANLLASIYSASLESCKYLVLVRNINSITFLISLLLSAIFVLAYKDVVYLAVCQFLGAMSRLFLLYYYTKTKIRDYKFKFLKNFSILKKIIKDGGFFQLSRIANIVSTSTDTVFITSFLGPTLVPVYTFTTKLPQMASITLASKVPNILFVGFSELIENNQIDKVKNIFQSMLILLVRFGLFFSIYIFFYNSLFINLWVGEKYFAGSTLNIVIVILMLYDFVIRGSIGIIYAYGSFKKIGTVSIAEVLINIILSIVLIKIYGLFGLILATLLSRFFTTGLLFIKFTSSNSLIDASLGKRLVFVVITAFPTVLFFFFFDQVYSSNSWVKLILAFLSGILINFISYDLRKWLAIRKTMCLKDQFYYLLLNNSSR